MTYAIMLKVLCHGFHPSSIDSREATKKTKMKQKEEKIMIQNNHNT